MSDDRKTPTEPVVARERRRNTPQGTPVAKPPRPDGSYAVCGTPIAKVSDDLKAIFPPMDEVDDDSDPGRLTAADIVLPDVIQRACNPSSLPPNASETQQVLAVVRWAARSMAQMAASFQRHRQNQQKQHGENRGELGLIAGHVGSIEQRVVGLENKVDDLTPQLAKATRAGHYLGLTASVFTLLAALVGLIIVLVQGHHAASPQAPAAATSAHTHR